MITQVNKDIILDLFKALISSEQDYKNKVKTSEINKDGLSVLNCFNGLLLYLKGEFTSALRYFKDAEILVSNNGSNEEIILYNFLLGYVNFCEKNNNLYMLHYNKSLEIANNNDLKEYLSGFPVIKRSPHLSAIA